MHYDTLIHLYLIVQYWHLDADDGSALELSRLFGDFFRQSILINYLDIVNKFL